MDTPLSCHLALGTLKVSRTANLVWMNWRPPEPSVIAHLLSDLGPEDRERVEAEWAAVCEKIQGIISQQFDA